MKVLHVIPAFYPATYWGGPIYSLHELCNSLASIDAVELRVLTTNAAGPRRRDDMPTSDLPSRLYPGYDVYYCRRTAGASFSTSLLARLPTLVKWADIVHLTGVFSSPTIPTLAICKALDRPMVWSPRGGFYRWQGARRQSAKRAWNFVCHSLFPATIAIHCTSEKEEVESRAAMPGCRTVIIPNGTSISEQKPRRQRGQQDHIRLLYMGLISPVKALDKLIAAMALLDNRFLLDIYGSPAHGYETFAKQIKKQAAESPRSEAIKFHGFVMGERKHMAFSSADILVVPSHSENFSNVVPEALASGLPVIVSKGAPWSSIEDQKCGMWVDNDPSSLAIAAVTMAKMDLAEMGARGRAWIQSSFTWGTVAEQTRAVYQRLIMPPALNNDESL